MTHLIDLRDKIQKLNKFHQLEIFRIFKTQNAAYTENRNGIFINMNNLDKDTLKILEEYLNYVSTQQDHLDTIERQKEQYKISFFKDNKGSCDI